MNSRPLLFPGCVVLVCLWTSCEGSRSSEALASSGSRSSYEEPIPTVAAVEEGLTVRPDVLRLPFAFRQETDALELAVPKLKAAVERYTHAVAETSKGEVAAKLKDGGLEWGKVRTRSEARVQGVLEVALPESLDFWGRMELVARLIQVGDQEAAAAEKADTGLHASFGAPLAQVRDPEAHRDGLMKRWVERARGFMSQAQSPEAPLRLVGCAPPGAVTQQAVSVDEVVLSLAVSCHLDVVAK
jgi:hypothetical protein